MDTITFRLSSRAVDVPHQKVIELEDRLVKVSGGVGVIEAISARPRAGVLLTSTQKALVLGVLNDWGTTGTAADLGDELLELRDQLHREVHPS